MRRGLVLCAALLALLPSTAAAVQTRFSLVGGCYAVQGADGTRSAPLRLHAAGLGAYLLYTADGRYETTSGARIASDPTPTVASIYRVDSGRGGTFRLRTDGGRTLGIDGSPQPASDVGVAGGQLLPSSAGTRVSFLPADGCATVPEATTQATGAPMRGSSAVATTRGLMDSHAHLMAFDFLGGDFHCGKPWSPLGVTVALPDCASIQGPNGTGAPVQNFLDFGQPVAPHDTVGWPTFVDWPTHEKLSYEQTYFKWLERSWRGGLRLIVNDFVENEALCALMPKKKTDCDDMSAVRRQRTELYALQDYIDAQSGGPGRGWFRIVTSPWAARRVINDGKIAVVMGIELSRVLGCGVVDGASECTMPEVEQRLDDVQRLGIRSFFPVHKFDNGFGGTKMDGDALGPLVNTGNFAKTGRPWDVATCEAGIDPDNTQLTALPSGVGALLPAGVLPATGLPVYGPAPHCNTRGLTELGVGLLKAMAARGMVVEIDHMDQKTGSAALDVLESIGYSGVVSSHTWQHPADDPRILALGGVVSPYPKQAAGYVKQWQRLRTLKSPKYTFGLGYGADMNGLGDQAPPRAAGDSPAAGVSYPFKAFDSGVTLDRLRAGEQTWDLNEDGVANYGLLPDFWEDLRLVGGDQLKQDMLNGSEAYLEMWERAQGAPGPRCQPADARVLSRARGIGAVRLGASASSVLRRAGQPASRPGRSLRWCGGTRAVFTAGRAAGAAAGRVELVVRRGAASSPAVRVPRGTDGRGARAARVGGARGADEVRPVQGLRGRAGARVRVSRRAVGGRRVAYVLPRAGARSTRTIAVAAPSALRSARTLRAALAAAGVKL